VTAAAAVTRPAAPGVRRTHAPGIRRALGVAAMVVLVPLGWVAIAATRWLGPGFIGPWPALDTLIKQWGIIWYNAAPTIGAAVQGALVLLVIMAAGLLAVGLLPELTPWLVAVSVVAGSLPLISITPALSLFFTRGDELTTVVVACARVAQHGRADLGALYQASRLSWWRNVGFWRCVPALDLGLRAMFPACFVGAIVAEWSGAAGDIGLGSLMANALFSYQVPLLWATLLLAAAVSLGLLGVVAALMAPLRRVVR
jgi:ABC-type nitrate/sulfonate/bicarbonate transport system permease component